MKTLLTAEQRMRIAWDDVSRYMYWRDVEAQVLRALGCNDWWKVAGIQITEDDVAAIQKIEEKTQHDVAAFVDWLHIKTGIATIHYGLTSSDVVDTALSLQIRKALGNIREIAGRRGYPVHWLNQATREISVGTISGPVGTYSSLPPEIEKEVLGWLGLEPEPAPTQIIARDRHAAVMNCLALTAGVIDRIRGERSDEATAIRTWSFTAIQNIALWHERDISHSSTERHFLPDSFCALARLIER